MTISATDRFGKIRTAPKQEHVFRDSRQPNNINVAMLFPLCFRAVSDPPPGTPFKAIDVEFAGKEMIVGSLLEPTGTQNGTQTTPGPQK